MSKLSALNVACFLLLAQAGPARAQDKVEPSPGGVTFNRQISLGDLMNVVTAIATIAAVIYAARSFTADHTRRRKQATMEALSALRGEYREKWLRVREYGAGKITAAEVDQIVANPEKRKQLEDVLSLFEHVATGVNADVFDLALLNRLSGQYFMDVFDDCEQWMSKWRAEEKQKGRTSKYYEEFYIMVNDIRSARGLPRVKLP
jgi:Domain of unknown function (DUF4760)